MNESVKELHNDLARKYRQHGKRVEGMWRSLSQEQRKKIMEAGSHDGAVLKHAEDTSLENVYKFIPEWNLRDVTSPSSNFFLDMLKHRATSPLQAQYTTGFNGRPGDHAHILDMMQRKNLRLNDVSQYKDCYTLFLTEDGYGESVKILAEKQEVLANMKPAMQAGFIVPQATGELILMRQINLLQLLNIAIEDILDTASTTRAQTKQPNKSNEDTAEALAKLSIQSPPKKVELVDLVDVAKDRLSSSEDLIALISTEPTVLTHEVNFSFFSRPELVADEKGRMLPVHTDKYISGAVLDAVHGAVKIAATWCYIGRLLDLLKESTDKQFKAVVLKELSNTCHLEYLRTQTSFKRSVAVGMGGSKWFKRTSTNDIARLSLKRNPESLTVENPQLHYMLRLCQDETNWSNAAQWLQKLADLHRAHPLEQDSLSEREYDSLGDLAIIVTFIQSLSSIMQLPTPNHKKKQPFVSGCTALDKELREMKDGLDLGDFAIPIDNLLEQGMAEGALAKLDEYIVEKTGTKLGFLYEDLVESCVSNIHKQHEAQKAKSKVPTQDTTLAAPESSEPPIQQRRQKEKTRPSQGSIYEITPQSAKDDPPVESIETHKVKPSTANVFSSLFSRSSAARSPVRWEAFVAAMDDLSFSCEPKLGSIYTFVPSDKAVVRRGITLHRPHQGIIEGRLLLVFSQRLKRVYGWSNSTFEAA
ncbi:hypothetical protein COCMIDRAFT_7017 [Bipolaris oryzae ATCC 44560]|uniref:Ipa protein n=1 Tax=Bipolaris oryzae ATCC 44560 TaxID=930090 RepID=W6Z7M6_COCMI|nr:uncharacterized protein COCMIDRAFT_7017 [Bipolaris oryzae ATCC 44560]EUC43584.1 hypothetical protein COCMIDRAFT_7017 [Bipolaris oryzae ATCC 44560]